MKITNFFSNLVVDGMSIQEHLEFDNSIRSTIRYVDLGCFGQESEEVAKEALVVMLVGLRGHWKIPVAYYLVKGVSCYSAGWHYPRGHCPVLQFGTYRYVYDV